MNSCRGRGECAVVILGIDIGGSGIKGGVVDLESGELITERHRIPTPHPSRPKAVSKVVGEIAGHFEWDGPIGAGFPAAIQRGVALTAANVDKRWIGTDVAEVLGAAAGHPVTVINDADAAGLAEMRYGAGKDRTGVVLVITIGTGLGSALFIDGELVPNTEFGHIEVRGKKAERRASDAVRERKDLSWKKWARRFDEVLDTYERLLWPDLIILGGGASKKFEKYHTYLSVRADVLPAELRNHAGIIGAALAASRRSTP